MTLFLCAGDVSGDAHCALLMRAIRERHPQWRLCVLGGAQMQELADEVVGDARGLAVMGIGPALALLPRFIALQKQAQRWLTANAVDAALLCDWGAFNGRLLPHLKQQNVPTGYYFPPRSWRKTGPGASELAPLVRWFATPFEWDAQRLQAGGARAEWVGHPLLEIVRSKAPRAQLRQAYGVPDGAKLVALLPGSRTLELKYNAPHLAATARQLQQLRGYENTVFLVPTPRGVELPPVFRAVPNVQAAPGHATEALLACDAAIVKSGTATLEAAVCDAPQLVVYDVPPVLKWQGQLMGGRKKIPFVAMPNIILDKGIVREFLAEECRAENLLPVLRQLLEGDSAGEMRENYKTVRRALGEELPQGATARTVELIEELMS